MARSIAIQLGLLGFALAILAGLYAGNSPTTILTRALLVMVAAYAVGHAIGWAGKQVLRDHLRRRKLSIDAEHQATLHAMAESQAEQQAEQEQAPDTPAPAKVG